LSKTKTEDQIPTTLQEAKKMVYAKLCQNINPKEITQITFLIDDKITRFNPAQIRKIREEFEPKIEQNNRDPDKALCFKLFKKGKLPADVIIETGLTYEYVTKAYEEYCRLQGKKLVTLRFYDEVMESIKVIDEGYYEVDIEDAMNKFVDAYQELENYVCPCSVCGLNMDIGSKDQKDAKQEYFSKWGHSSCFEN